MNITTIEATKVPPLKAAAEGTSTQKLRVAAYCRTSTDSAEQETSFEAQKSHFTSYISENPNWELIDIYADEVSGTRVFKRENFLRMIKDCEDGKIDLVLAKSISRFARNTLDCLKYLRLLKSHGVVVIFTKEGISTDAAGGELLLSVMSAIAQQESASISQNVQIGLRYHFQEGKLAGGVHNLLGYKRTPEGSLAIVFEEAEIVRRIFRLYIDGYSMRHIARILSDEHVPGKDGKERNWDPASINYILKNEKYMGDLMLQKYYTVDYLTKKVKPNDGQLPRYYVEDNHPPIVPKAVFHLVQDELAMKKDRRSLFDMSLSGKVDCGYCSAPFRRRENGNYTYWRCASKVDHKYDKDGCEADGVPESALKESVIRAFNLLPFERAELVEMRRVINEETLVKADVMLKSLSSSIKALEEGDSLSEAETDELIGLQTKFASVKRRKADFMARERRIRDLLERIDFIEEIEPEGCTISASCSEEDDFYRRTRKMYKTGPVTEFKDDDVNRFVEMLHVYNDHIEVQFKAGVTVSVDRDKTECGIHTVKKRKGTRPYLAYVATNQTQQNGAVVQ